MATVICQGTLDRFVLPAELALAIVFPTFKVNDDIRNGRCHGAVSFHEHRMKVVERVYEEDCRIVPVD